MALRDQPYIPLYVQDFMTDEKLMECSAESTGVYIRLMCLMHKSDPYGKVLLKQKFKQNSSTEQNFASQLAKHLPYDLLIVERSLTELINEGVLIIEGDTLYQKRMVKDARTSDSRSKSGLKGGIKTQNRIKNFALAKSEANSEYEYEIEDHKEKRVQGEKQFTWDTEKYSFLHSGDWIFKFCTDKKIPVDVFDVLANEFISDVELKEDFKLVKELRSHFTNWYNKKTKNGHTAVTDTTVKIKLK